MWKSTKSNFYKKNMIKKLQSLMNWKKNFNLYCNNRPKKQQLSLNNLLKKKEKQKKLINANKPRYYFIKCKNLELN